jgi:hypothetical protein
MGEALSGKPLSETLPLAGDFGPTPTSCAKLLQSKME